MAAAIIVRKALLQDVGALIHLLKLLFEIETDFLLDEQKQRAGLEMLLLDQNRCCLMVAEVQREVIGMCSVQLLVSTAEGGLKAMVEDLVVTPSYRGQKIGRRLLAAVEEWALNQGAKRMDLLADGRNTPALSFYKKLNWRRTELVGLQKKV